MVAYVIDIETTGLLKFQTNAKTGRTELSDDSEILEVGYLAIDTYTKEIMNHGVLYFYKPYFNIESEAQSIHGLTRDFLQQYEGDFEKNLIILSSMTQLGMIIGKNCDIFDIPFIDAFIEKHGTESMNVRQLLASCQTKDIYGSAFTLDRHPFNVDVQKFFAPTFRKMYAEKTGITLSERKRGKLGEYIDVIPNGTAIVDTIYNDLDKARSTRAHGALYDAVMTYVVWYMCKSWGLLPEELNQ